jgi:plasmid stability protein
VTNLQVRNVDEATHHAVRARASAEGKTIAEYLLELIRRDLRKPTRSAWLEEARALPSLAVTSDDIRASLDADRAR